MKRQIIFGTMLSAALAVGVGAQQPPSAPPAQTPSTPARESQQSDSAKTVTMTGCLQAASSSGGGAAAEPGAPAAGAASQAKGFILASASPAGAKTGAEPGAPAGAPGAAGTSGTGSTYRLTGGADQNLEKYVGQRVEVTGTLSGRSMGSSSGAGAPGAGAGASGSSQSGPALNVSSVRATGESCSK